MLTTHFGRGSELCVPIIGTCPSGHITADKRLRYASSKFAITTSFIHKTLYAIPYLKMFLKRHLFCKILDRRR